MAFESVGDPLDPRRQLRPTFADQARSDPIDVIAEELEPLVLALREQAQPSEHTLVDAFARMLHQFA